MPHAYLESKLALSPRDILMLVVPTKHAVALIATGLPYASHGCELKGVSMCVEG